MTQFTWRDVAAPDFSKAATGFTEAGRLLQDTIGKASNGIEAFDKSQDTLAAEQLKMFIAKNQDPAALQAGFNAGSLGGMDLVGDPRMARAALAQLNPGAIDALVKTQRDRTLGTQTFDESQALVSMTPRLIEAERLAMADDLPGANKLLDGLPLASLGMEGARKLFGQYPGLARTAFTDATTRRDDSVETMAGNIVERAKLGAGTAGDATLAAQQDLVGLKDNSNFGRISQRTNELMGSAAGSGVLSGVAAPVGSVGSGTGGSYGSGGPAGSRSGDLGSVVFGYGQYGLPPRPLTEMTIAEASDWSKVIGEKTAAAGIGKTPDGRVVGTSAIGPFQIQGRSTLLEAAKELKIDIRTAKFDLATQERIAEHLFNKRKGGNMKAEWESIPDATPGAYKNKTWAEMRDIITRGETGADISVVEATALATQNASRAQSSNQDPSSFAARIVAAGDQKKQIGEVTSYMATAYKMSEKDAASALQGIVDRAKNSKSAGHPEGTNLTYDQALVIFNHARRRGGLIEGLDNFFDPARAGGKGFQLQNSLIDEGIRTYQSTQANKQVVVDTYRVRLEQANAAAFAAFNKADAALIAAKAASGKPGYKPENLVNAQKVRDRAFAAASMASAALDGNTSSENKNPDSQLLVKDSRIGNDNPTDRAEERARAAAEKERFRRSMENAGRTGVGQSDYLF